MINMDMPDWGKGGGLLPAIVQDGDGIVRMLGYMNREALSQTIESGFVTFFSRSKNRLWVKGETSGNRLRLREIAFDCDRDALLVRADPQGPTCHLETLSCFGVPGPFFPAGLEEVIGSRAAADPEFSYTARMRDLGINRLAQKVGEEAVEVALAAVSGERSALVGEAADLTFHLMLLLYDRGIAWREISAELECRHKERANVP